jgi:hypothetical protein
MKRFLVIVLALSTSYLFTYNTGITSHLPAYEIQKAANTITIDGNASEADWSSVGWRSMNQTWLGSTPTSADFTGRYKLLYDKNYLYVLAEITDDVLADNHTSPTDNYFNDDCLEIFVDENASGGPHRTNYNAFAYHVSLTNDWVDVGPSGNAATYNTHGTMARTNVGSVYTWECRLKLFPDNYIDGVTNEASILTKGKKIGFMLAYCDTDGTTASATREHFIGSYPIPGTDKNRGWLDASLFEKMYLK